MCFSSQPEMTLCQCSVSISCKERGDVKLEHNKTAGQPREMQLETVIENITAVAGRRMERLCQVNTSSWLRGGLVWAAQAPLSSLTTGR